MDIKKVEGRIKEIRKVKGDNELSHIREDELWCDVLSAISEGAENAQELATKCLETRNIEFVRWYA